MRTRQGLAGVGLAFALAALLCPAPALARAPVVAAAGDIACDPGDAGFNGGEGTATRCRQKQTSDLLLGLGLDAVLVLGDSQYEDGTLAKFGASYDPSWGRLRAITRPAVGNHEYLDPAGGAEGYFDYFNGVGVESGPAGTRGAGYYSFDLGAWHLVALNTNCAEVGGCGSGSPQGLWLRQDLAASGDSCLLAYGHHPLFTSFARGPYPQTRPLWEALHEHGADLVLVGHDHHYERFAPMDPDGSADPSGGIREFIAGAGGKSIREVAGPRAAGSEALNDEVFGALKLTLDEDRYSWEYLSESGVVLDSGSEVCHRAAAPEPDPGPGDPGPGPSGGIPAELRRVLSGQKIAVSIEGPGHARVRLLGIRTGHPSRCRGRRALRALERRLSPGDGLVLRADSVRSDRGRGGSLRRYAELGDRDLGRWMLRSGHARTGRRGFDRRPSYLEAERRGRGEARKLRRSCRRR